MIIKLTKHQRQELLNCHNGVGFICVKINDYTLKMAEFFTTQKGEVRILNEQLDWQKFCKEVET